MSQPKNLASVSTQNSITITYNPADTGSDSYKVAIRPGDEVPQQVTTATNEKTHTFNDLMPCATYTVAVVSVRNGRDSAPESINVKTSMLIFF
ncbi:unnamed protein product [Protopolystoma xenopodis]|uniref:Fibronectin type-III domain-containing protein n=1 Tax=Protopolystoma xenopodis TaxID=117903 RepID=A0A3S5AWF0_9PLAT|nr:unnamed protein product [Protopolystoma xenopodis]